MASAFETVLEEQDAIEALLPQDKERIERVSGRTEYGRKGRDTRLNEVLANLRNRREQSNILRSPWSPEHESVQKMPLWSRDAPASRPSGGEAATPYRRIVSDLASRATGQSRRPSSRGSSEVVLETPPFHEKRARKIDFTSQKKLQDDNSAESPKASLSELRDSGAKSPWSRTKRPEKDVMPESPLSQFYDTFSSPGSDPVKLLPTPLSLSRVNKLPFENYEQSTDSQRGIRAPDFDSDSSDSESDDILTGWRSESPTRVISRDSVVNLDEREQDQGREAWTKASCVHVDRINKLVMSMEHCRQMIEAELRENLVDIELNSYSNFNNNFGDATIAAADKALDTFEKWKTQRQRRYKRHYDELKAKMVRAQEREEAALAKKRAEEVRLRAAQEQAEQAERAEKAEQEEQAKREKEKKQAEELRRKAEEKKVADRKAAEKRTAKEKQEGVEEYEKFQAYLKQIEKQAEAFKSDSSQSQLRLQLKKRIGLAVNQIAASQKQVRRVAEVLLAQLNLAKQSGEAAIAFAENLIAERIVQEGKGQVMLHVHSGYPIAAVAVFLIASYKQLAPLLVAHFHQACPYTVPRYIKKLKGQSEAEYREVLGYHGDETTERYYERMSGYLSLYAAIVQTDFSHVLQKKNPIGLSRGWTWLARIVNMEPKRITGTLIIAFLEVAGYELYICYKRQFIKLLNLIVNKLLPTMPKDCPPGPLARIQVFAEDCFSGRLAMPKGKNLPASDAVNM